MKEKRLLPILFSFALLMLCFFPAFSCAESFEYSDTVFTVMDTEGKRIFTRCGAIHEGDEYISADNTLYRIIRVDHETAVAQKEGIEPMPDVSWLDTGSAQPVFAKQNGASSGAQQDGGKKLIAMYVTHSDESYVPTDGTESIEGQGGIYDVAREFRDALQNLGIDVILDESTHLPHDSGAYRRSRQTAERLIKKMPDAIIDIHRDGIPDAEEYKVTLDGKNASQVRLLVGRANQNSAVNREFAKELKAVADKQYPGLIKDIFIGKGTYNQDLSPNAVLLEFGTHTISKDRVLNSVDEMAHVVSTTLYGTLTGSAKSTETAAAHSAQKKTRSSFSGIAWMIALTIAGVLLFTFVQTGTASAMKDKIKRGASEITGGILGGRKKDKQD